LPLTLVAKPVDGDITCAAITHRQVAGGVIADVALRVGIHKILARAGEPRKHNIELFPVLRPIQVEKRKIQRLGVSSATE
jgi:hypothetical protein